MCYDNCEHFEYEARCEIDLLSKHIIHCANCGDTYYDSGMSAGCPMCRIAKVEAEIKRLIALKNELQPSPIVAIKTVIDEEGSISQIPITAREFYKEDNNDMS